jgi:hypothetical protein
MAGRKTEFWWASIHGADPEPVEKTKHEDRPCVYTLGCADPFYLDEPGVKLLTLDDDHLWVFAEERPARARQPMKRALLPDKAIAAKAAEEARIRRYNE